MTRCNKGLSYKKRHMLRGILLTIMGWSIVGFAIPGQADIPPSIKERHQAAQEFMRGKVAVILASDSKSPLRHRVADYAKQMLEKKVTP